MGIRVSLHHRTEYRYDRLVTLGPQVVRLRPAPHSRTPVASYALKVEPGQHFLNWQQDPQGNSVARLVFPEPTDHFVVDVGLVADLSVINPFDFFLEPAADDFPFVYEPALAHELRPFLETHPGGARLEEFVASVDRTPRPTIGFLFDLNARLQRMIRYMIRMEPGVQTPDETLALECGSCRDSAWLEVEVLRRLRLAARFCSGYLIQLQPDEKPLEGPPGPEKDFTDLHAWTEVYLPGAGWVGLDPTSGLFAGEGYIPLAATPEPGGAAPVAGMVSACEVEFHHEMSVVRIHEDPRVTKPYREENWERVYALGQAEAFWEGIAKRLAISTEFVIAAYEDPLDPLAPRGPLPGGAPKVETGLWGEECADAAALDFDGSGGKWADAERAIAGAGRGRGSADGDDGGAAAGEAVCVYAAGAQRG